MNCYYIYCRIRSKMSLEDKETFHNYSASLYIIIRRSHNRLSLLIESLSVIVVKIKQ